MPTMMQSHVTLSARVKLNAGSSIILRVGASSTSSSELGPANLRCIAHKLITATKTTAAIGYRRERPENRTTL